jgi:hypothetical protein
MRLRPVNDEESDELLNVIKGIRAGPEVGCGILLEQIIRIYLVEIRERHDLRNVR